MTEKQRAAMQQAEPVEPVAWVYTGIKQDGTEHGPHLVWKPEYMDAMSASKGAKATPLYTALRAALAQQAEPVAWEGWWLHHGQHNYRAKPLSPERVKELMKLAFEVGRESAPPRQKPLTDEEIPALAEKAWEPSVYCDAEALLGTDGLVALVRAVEQAHGIKE